MSQIIIGYTTEGTTDVRLLESIIVRTFVDVGLECKKEIEVIGSAIHIERPLGFGFKDQIFQCAKKAFERGIMAFCVHTDADTDNDNDMMTNKIEPSFNYILQSEDTLVCKNLVAIVPVQMSEAWMLADKQLLKDGLGTSITDFELGISQDPQIIANPKSVISNAIRIARQHVTKRRRGNLSISDLHQPIGQKVSLDKLMQLSSYRKFYEAVRNAYKRLNYLT